MTNEDRIPVLIAFGEINDRPAIETEGRDSIALMLAALEEAERDVGTAILGRLDWLGVEDQISFPDPVLHETLGARLPRRPHLCVKTHEASGDGPIQLIHDAANLIGEGKIRLGAAVGAEALRTAAKRAQALIAAGHPPVPDNLAASAAAAAPALARKHGLFSPTDVYPLYENATRAAWGQTLDEAQRETATIWSKFSAVAADNPAAWLRKALPPEVIAEATNDNRMISFPYTKLMVANSSVNQGAAVIIASLAMARELGVPDNRIVYLGAGAAAHETADFLKRDSYAHSTSLATTLTQALELNALDADQLDCVELYSCFPCVPKMARRILGWPVERPATVYGGLTFGGGPIGNCMMHAMARMIDRLRGDATNGLIVANGGYATHSHSIVLTRNPVPFGTFPQDYNAQALADARRGAEPELIESYEGPARIETFTIPFDRHGSPRHATIIARTPQDARFVAHVPGDDHVMLDRLMDRQREAVGLTGRASLGLDGKIMWAGRARSGR